MNDTAHSENVSDDGASPAELPQIAFVVYEGMTTLDLIGPLDVMSRWPGYESVVVGLEAGVVRNDNGVIGLVADHSIDDVPAPAVIVVPGGVEGTLAAAGDERLLDWLRTAAPTAEFVTSVCTGSLILGAAGLLEGRPATTHWGAREVLASFGALVSEERVVDDGQVVTGAGVSAGIDMALTLTARRFGDDFAQVVQLAIEYDPQPPFNSGSPATAPPHVMELGQQFFS